MTLLDRYIGRTVLVGSLMALLVLGTLAGFFTFIDELDKLDERYTVGKVAAFVLLTLPSYLYAFFPMGVLIGSLLMLGNLAANSELVVMRASGISIQRLVVSVMLPGLLLMVLGLFMGEGLAPPAFEYAQNLRAEAKSEDVSLERGGLWVRQMNKVVHVERVLQDQQLGGVTVYEFDGDARLLRRTAIASVKYHDNLWQLSNVNYITFHGDHVSVTHAPSEQWESLLRPELFDVLVVAPEHMPIWDLADYISYLQANGLDAQSYRLAFWIKVFSPFSTLVMLVLVMPFVFGSQRTGGAGQQIFIGIMLGLAYLLIGRMLNHLGPVYGLPPVLSAALPLVLFLLAGLWGLRRVS